MEDDSGAVEGVVEPEVGGEGVVRSGGDDAIFEVVAGLQAEDADGLDADILVGGGVDDGGIRIVGDGGGEGVGGAAAWVGGGEGGGLGGFGGGGVGEIEG